MKGVVISAALFIGVAVALLAAISFWLTGGFVKLGAEHAVTRRGEVATEPLTAPGFAALKAPAGWAINDSLSYPYLQARTDPFELTAEGDARVFLALGQYQHVGGGVSAAKLEIAARDPAGPTWSPPAIAPFHVSETEVLQVEWVKQTRPDLAPLDLYTLSNRPPGAQSVWLILHDPTRGVRVDLQTTAVIYPFETAVKLARSVLESAQPDLEALRTAPRERG